MEFIHYEKVQLRKQGRQALGADCKLSKCLDLRNNAGLHSKSTKLLSITASNSFTEQKLKSLQN
jgi:hypothetical protein